MSIPARLGLTIESAVGGVTTTNKHVLRPGNLNPLARVGVIPAALRSMVVWTVGGNPHSWRHKFPWEDSRQLLRVRTTPVP